MAKGNPDLDKMKSLNHRCYETDPYRLIVHLHRHEVEYVLVGETAEIIHGAPFAYRDFDIAPNPEAANIARLMRALKSILNNPFSSNRKRINTLEDQPITDFETWHGPVSVVLCAGDHGTSDFAQLREQSWEPQEFGGMVCVASLSDLIETREILSGKYGEIPGLKRRRGDGWHWLHLKAMVQFREENPGLAPEMITQDDPHLPNLRDMSLPA